MDPFLSAFQSHAAKDPGSAACLSPDHACTRAELAAQVERAAVNLARRGIGAGALVALSAPPGPAFVAAWLALRAREACALLLDPGAAPRERARVLEQMGASHVWILDDPWERADLPGTLEPFACTAPATMPGIATLKLTSGSSGAPCGIAVRAQELLADGHNLISSMELCEQDRFLCTIPFTHSYGFSLLPTALCLLGAALVLPGADDPLEVCERFGATVVPSVPAWFSAQLALRSAGLWPARPRLCISAGAPLPIPVARAWRERSGRPIHAFYGSSECGGISFDRSGGAAERGTVGTPLEGVTVELVAEGSSETGGVVRVRSAAVASGYHRVDAARAARLGAGSFESDDLGRFEQGELVLGGRRSDWINVKGFKVDPREVELALVELPGVLEVAVVAEPLPEGRGEAVRAIVACAEGALRYQDIVAWCRARLAAHKVPRSVLLVRALPRNERGKLDRGALGTLGAM